MTIMKCFRMTAAEGCWWRGVGSILANVSPPPPQPPASWAKLGNIENNFKTHLKFCLQPEPSWAGCCWLGSITTGVSLQ